MENRFGLAMDTRVTRATRTAEREAAFSMVADIPGVHRITVGEIKGYDCMNFAAGLRRLAATPYVA